MISYKIFVNGNSFQRKKTYGYSSYFTVVLGLDLKQHLFPNKLQRAGLGPC